MVDAPETLEEIALSPTVLRALLIESARLGAAQAISDMKTFTLKEAAATLDMSYNTLRARIKEGKIREVDGRISGAELRRYSVQK